MDVRELKKPLLGKRDAVKLVTLSSGLHEARFRLTGIEHLINWSAV